MKLIEQKTSNYTHIGSGFSPEYIKDTEMRLSDITPTLQAILNCEVHPIAPNIWEGTTPNFHFLVRRDFGSVASKDDTVLGRRG